MFLDLNGPGNLLGLLYWETHSPLRGGSSILNTGPAPLNAEDVYSLSRILQDAPPRKYYLSRTACLGILRRAKERGKELPFQLKWALMSQAGLAFAPPVQSGLKAYHINQREKVNCRETAREAALGREGIDLGGVAGALMATINGVPAQAQRSGLRGERRSSEMSELSLLGGSEGYEACDDAQMQTFLTGEPIAFTANQRDEVRKLHGVTGALGAQPGMKQQTFIAGFSAGAGAKAGSIGYSEKIAPTLKGTASGNCMPSVLCLNDQGGSVMECSEDISGTLRAQEHGHQPLVLASQQGGAEIGAGICPTVTAAAGMSGNNQPVLFENHGIDGRYTGPHPVSPTLSARGGTGGNNLPLVADECCICITGNTIDRQPQNGGNGIGIQSDISYTLTATDHHAVFSRQRVDVFKDDDVASTESARQNRSPAAIQRSDCGGERSSSGMSELSPLGGSEGYGACGDADATDLVYQPEIGPLLIRRLTPLECERLQGFPDGWTDLPGASDSARYKALGNSVAIPCVEFIMRGIIMAMDCTA